MLVNLDFVIIFLGTKQLTPIFQIGTRVDEDFLKGLITEKKPGNACTLLWSIYGSLPVSVGPHVGVLEYPGLQSASQGTRYG